MASTLSTSEKNSNPTWKALYDYEVQQAELKRANPAKKNDYDQVSRRLKQDHFAGILAERRQKVQRVVTIASTKNAMRRLLYSLRPSNLLLSIILLPFQLLEAILLLATRQVTAVIIYNREVKDIHQRIATDKNMEHLSASLKNAGFTMAMDGPLRKMLELNQPQFDLRYVDPRLPKTDFNLHFSKIPGTNSYILENFTAIARPTLESFVKQDPHDLAHTFTGLAQNPMNAADASKLVNGRPVFQEIEGQGNWMSLVGSTIQNGEHKMRTIAFDVEKEIRNKPEIVSGNPGQFKKLMDTLKRNGQAIVTIRTPMGDQKLTVSVGPFADRLNFADKNGKLVDYQNLARPGQQDQAKQILARGERQNMGKSHTHSL